MTDDIEELKELVEKNTKLAEDTNRTVHKMRRSALWGRFFQLAWWIAIIAVSGAAYYIYLQPYVGQIEALYEQFKTSGQQVQDFLQSFGAKPPDAPAQ
jgi:hypothetical protein